MIRFRGVTIATLLFLLLTQLALAADIVYLVRTGTDAEGNPLFRMADSRDTYLSGLFELTQSSRALHEVGRFYEAIQKDQLTASLQARGLSGSQIQTALSSYPSEPVFIEVTNSSAGAYNDWKGRFSVTYPNGQAYTFDSPRVSFPLNGDVMRSGNRALIEQTLVHEIGHGVMRQASGREYLPDSPWLSKAHSGGSVTDEQLAFIEGWAEFVGAYFTGRTTIAEDPSNTITSNWYAQGSNGRYKAAGDLVRTEGYIATVLYKISVDGKSQNAAWKMAQVMARTKPQSTMQLLANVAAYYPELVPTINQVMSSTSGGQIPGVGSSAQYAYGYTAPSGGYGSTGSGSLQEAFFGSSQNAYSGYASYANYQRQAYGSSQGSAGYSAGINADLNQLAILYAQKQQQLQSVPWWKFWEKSKIENELTMIEDLYNRQVALAQYAAAPQTGTTPTGEPAEPTSVRASGTAGALSQTSGSVVDAARTGDTRQLEQALEAHRRQMESRQLLRQQGPQGER